MNVIDGTKLALIVNALREKAAGDRGAIAQALGVTPTGVLNGAAGGLAQTLEQQAVEAEALADEIENANHLTVEN